ncbi:MAG: HEAT repeat domain-containing protein [Methylococcaceae bacterium]|nr:HEAT repeat domain-containing protein [Methylococcaceae bacterium]
MLLEVRQMPMAQVLDAVARKAHVIIHYSVLPEGLVTATCGGSTLKQVLECLLNRKADIIVRSPQNSTKTNNQAEQLVEAWILGSKLTNSSTPENCVATSGQANEQTVDNISFMLSQDGSIAETELDQTKAELLKSAQSQNSAEREEAVGALLTAGHQDDPDIKAALEKALSDPDANVRAQAISNLALREGSGAAGAIQEALHDSSADVRLSAVDGIIDDIPLLQQALNDSDETVRSLATSKLELLVQGNGGEQ